MMLLETTLRQHWKLSFELFIRNGIDMGWLKLSRWEDENQTVVLLNPVENVNLHIIMWNLSRSFSTIIINIETIQELTRKQRQYYQVNWITQMRRIFNHSFTSNTHRVAVIWNGLPMFVINRCVWQNNQIDCEYLNVNIQNGFAYKADLVSIFLRVRWLDIKDCEKKLVYHIQPHNKKYLQRHLNFILYWKYCKRNILHQFDTLLAYIATISIQLIEFYIICLQGYCFFFWVGCSLKCIYIAMAHIVFCRAMPCHAMPCQG